MYIAAVTDHA